MENFDPKLHVNITLHSVPPDRFFGQLKEWGLQLSGYTESMCMCSVYCPASMVFEIEQHRDVMKVRITTTPFMLQKMREQMENNNE